MFRPITRSLSRSNEQNCSFSPENTSSQAPSALTNFAMPRGQLPPQTRPSREFSRPQNYPSWPNDNGFDRPHDPVYYFRTATHTDLLQAGNPTYGSLYDTFMGIQGRYEELRASYNKLTDTVKTTMDSSGKIASSTAAPQSALVSQALKFKREEYPKIRFVTLRNYNDFQKEKTNAATVLDPALGQKKRGGTRLASNNENVATDYIEHKDGTIVMGDTAKSIRLHARAVFIEMDNHPSMKLPTSWSLAGITERKFFIQEMYDKFPYLGLCDDDWKVLYLASRALSTFHEFRRRQAKKTTVVKSEVKSERIDPQIKIELQANDGPGLGATDVDADDGADFYMSDSAPPTPQPKRKTPLSSTATQRVSKRPRSSTNVVYDLMGDSDEELANSSTTAAIPPTSSPSSSKLSEPPSSSAPTTPASLPSPKLPSASFMASRPKPRPRIRPTAQQAAVVAKTHAKDHPPVETAAAKAPAMSADSEDLPRTNLPSAGAAETQDATPTEDSAPAISVENPFASLFGPATGPSGRLESLGEISTKGAQKDTKGAVTKEASNASGKVPSASESTARSKIFGPGTKKVTNSSSAKNLYYIDYLQTNDPITPAAFETHWSGLDKDTIKVLPNQTGTCDVIAEIHAAQQISEVGLLYDVTLARHSQYSTLRLI